MEQGGYLCTQIQKSVFALRAQRFLPCSARLLISINDKKKWNRQQKKQTTRQQD